MTAKSTWNDIAKEDATITQELRKLRIQRLKDLEEQRKRIVYNYGRELRYIKQLIRNEQIG